MIRGTTPTHIFKLPFEKDVIKAIRIIYAQNNQIVLVKNTEDCVLENGTATVKLTQEDTLSFDSSKSVEIQVRVLTAGEDALVSNIKCISVERCLDKDVI